jgi:hypothetical protein
MKREYIFLSLIFIPDINHYSIPFLFRLKKKYPAFSGKGRKLEPYYVKLKCSHNRELFILETKVNPLRPGILIL